MMKATKDRVVREQSTRFLGGVMMDSRVYQFFESLSGEDQKQMAMYGSLPQKMALALASSDHRAKSLLGRDGNDGLVYACLRFNPTIEFEVEEQLHLKQPPITFMGRETGRNGRMSGRMKGSGIDASYSVSSDPAGRCFKLEIHLRANGKPFKIPSRSGSAEPVAAAPSSNSAGNGSLLRF